MLLNLLVAKFQGKLKSVNVGDKTLKSIPGKLTEPFLIK